MGFFSSKIWLHFHNNSEISVTDIILISSPEGMSF